jgi:Uma2 family endonuclease
MGESPTYTVDDLFALPDLGTRTELIDGSLVLPRPQTQFHSVMTDLLVCGLRRTVPEHLKVERQMTVVLDQYNAPQPDLSVVRAEAAVSLDQDRFSAQDLVLAVEVVSPDSRARDRDAKPRKYAAAGIPYFWLVEMADPNQHPVVRAYEIDPVNKTYALTGIHHDHLKLTAPYDIDIDVTLDALKKV